MIKNWIYSTLVLTVTTSAFAQSGVTDDDLQLNTITTAVPFVSITPDSRAGGMADAGTALSGSSYSVYWNTAMLNFAEDRSDISISYTPWLRQLTNDIHLSYLSSYYQLDERNSVGVALRFFNLGEITFTNADAEIIREDKPSEYEITGAYALKLSDKISVGVNGKFIYSNLTGGLTVNGVDTKAGIAAATDLSFAYVNDDAKIGGVKGTYSTGVTINNIGNKIAYSNVSNGVRDFLPANLKIGNAYQANFDAYNKLTFSIDLQKLLVPTPPTIEIIDGDPVVISGRNNNVGVIAGMLQSFYDAPGTVAKDEVSGEYLQNPDGSYQVVSGSKFKEELSEINIATGLEYWYNNVFAVRGGFFYESLNKGARQFFNFGVGLKYNKFGVDISYLAAVRRNNPLANTLRFSLRFVIDGKGATRGDSTPE